MNLQQPPPGWRQHVRRGLPFPPGRDFERFDVLIDREKNVFHVNTTSGEVFRQVGERWDAPPWWELPDMVKREIMNILARETKQDR